MPPIGYGSLRTARLTQLRWMQVVVGHGGCSSRWRPRFAATPPANPGCQTRRSAAPQGRIARPLSLVPAPAGAFPQSTPGRGQQQPAAARTADRAASRTTARRRPGRRRSGRWSRDPYREPTAANHSNRDARRLSSLSPRAAPWPSRQGARRRAPRRSRGPGGGLAGQDRWRRRSQPVAMKIRSAGAAVSATRTPVRQLEFGRFPHVAPGGVLARSLYCGWSACQSRRRAGASSVCRWAGHGWGIALGGPR